MKINLTRKFHSLFESKNENGQKILLDGPKEVGGKGVFFRPMELLLTSLAGCSAVDILLILQKSHQVVEEFDIEIKGKRSDSIPAVFTEINLHFLLSGKINKNKLKRAVNLSLKKYCSIAKMLENSVNIIYTYELKNS